MSGGPIYSRQAKLYDIINIASVPFVAEDKDLVAGIKKKIEELIASGKVDSYNVVNIASAPFVAEDKDLVKYLKVPVEKWLVTYMTSLNQISLKLATFMIKADITLNEFDNKILEAIIINRLKEHKSIPAKYKDLPLHASAFADPFIMGFLLKQGHDMKQIVNDETLVDLVMRIHPSDYAKYLSVILEYAILYEDIETIIQVTYLDISLPATKFNFVGTQKTAIDLAVEFDNVEILTMMLSIILKPSNEHGFLASDHDMLSFLTSINSFDAIKYLAHKGLDINVCDKIGAPFLNNLAADAELAKVIELVRCGVNINIIDEDGYSPLHISAVRGDPEIVKYLAQSGANINAQTNDGHTALHLVCASNKGRTLEILRFLVEDMGADLTIRSESEMVTACDIACDSSCDSSIEDYLRPLTEAALRDKEKLRLTRIKEPTLDMTTSEELSNSIQVYHLNIEHKQKAIIAHNTEETTNFLISAIDASNTSCSHSSTEDVDTRDSFKIDRALDRGDDVGGDGDDQCMQRSLKLARVSYASVDGNLAALGEIADNDV